MRGLSTRNSVLVIDDDPDFRALISMTGQMCGVPVVEAADCRSGLRVLRHDHATIKMVLLDYFMPGMDAKTCASSILAIAGSTVSVVLVTAAVDAGSRAAQLRVSHWVSKPVELSVLIKLLKQNGLQQQR